MRHTKIWTLWAVFTIGCLCTHLLSADKAEKIDKADKKAETPLTDEQREQLSEAVLLDGRVELFFKKGNPHDALPLAQKALAIRRKALGKEHPATAQSLNFLGFLYQADGDSDAARASLEEALAIRKKILGEDHPETAESLNNLAIFLFQSEGDAAGARPYFEQSLKIKQKAFGVDHPDTVRALNYLGAVYISNADYAAARPYWEQALKITEKAFGAEHANTTAAMQNMGFLLQSQGDLKAARSFYEQALKIRRKILGEEHLETVPTLNHLGFLLQSQEDYPAAKACCEQALKISRKTFGEEHADTATGINNLGTILEAMGDLAAARTQYEQALKIRKKVLGEGHPERVWSLNKLLTLEAGQDHWKIATGLQDEARREIRKYIAGVLPTLPENDQLKFLYKQDAGSLHAALSIALIQKDDPQVAEMSANWLLNGKRIAQAAMAEQTLLKRDERLPDLAGNLRELRTVRQKLDAPQKNPDQARKEAVKLLVVQEKLTRQLAETGGRTTVAEPWIELAAVRKTLPAKSAYVDIARVNVRDFKARGKAPKWQPARYVAWIIPPADQGAVRVVDLGPAEAIDGQVQSVRKALEDVSSQNKTATKEEKAESGQKLQTRLQEIGTLVWKPLAEKLGDAKQLFVSPDSSLWLLPWNALPIAENKQFIEEYTLTQVMSGRDLVSNVKVKGTIRKPVLVTIPDFDLSTENVKKAIKDVLRNVNVETAIPTRRLSFREELPKVSLLTETTGEVQPIRTGIEKYAGSSAQLYTEQFALETILKQVQRPKAISFGTHAFFLKDQEVKLDENQLANAARILPRSTDGKPIENPLTRCGLYLAGCNTQQITANDDGLLTGMEILGIELRGTELVLLPACETGSGDVQNGNEVATLWQSLQLAGARSVVSTLWKIPTTESAPLLKDFLTNLSEGQSRTDALRNAQLKQIAAQRETPVEHPYFWATLTLVGR